MSHVLSTSDTNSNTKPAASQVLTLRQPVKEDGHAIFTLVKQSPPLDLNSCYSYLLLCTHWCETCVVATSADNTIVGFISAYLLPAQSDTLFVWQVAVDANQRGKGVAMCMLEDLLQRKITRQVRYLDTTITPDNKASEALFKRFAQSRNAQLNISTAFSVDDFGSGDCGPDSHLPEMLYHIGPLQPPPRQ